jgi:hypothetical protein
MPQRRGRPVLPSPGELKGAAIIYLRDGCEDTEAKLLAACRLELNGPNSKDGHYLVDITLRSNRRTVDQLHLPEEDRPSPQMLRIRVALKKALPVDCELGEVDARTALPSMDQQLQLALALQPQPQAPAPVDNKTGDYVFVRQGEFWRVSFQGSPEFFIKDTLGAAYLALILHRPNEALSALDIELAARGDRARYRPDNAPEQHTSEEILNEYRIALKALSRERVEAQENDDLARIEAINEEVLQIRAQIRRGKRVSNNAQRAGDNVRKAIEVVLRRLAKGDKHQKAFAEHVRQHVQTGKDCLYSQLLG